MYSSHCPAFIRNRLCGSKGPSEARADVIVAPAWLIGCIPLIFAPQDAKV
jgi:hypothetical protein